MTVGLGTANTLPSSEAAIAAVKEAAAKFQAEKTAKFQSYMPLEELNEWVSEHWQSVMSSCYKQEDGWRVSALVTIQCPFPSCAVTKHVGLIMSRKPMSEVRVYCNGCSKQLVRIMTEVPLPVPAAKKDQF